MKREAYEKPKVTRVKIESKEMAVGSCKIFGGSTAGPGQSCHRTPHSACRTQGS